MEYNVGKTRPAGWGGPLLMMSARLPLVLLGQFLLFAALGLAGDPQAWARATSYGNVYIVLVADLGCLLLLAWVVRREGGRLWSLIGFDRSRLWRDVLIGLALFVTLTVVFVSASMLSLLVVYGPGAFDPSGSSTQNAANLLAPALWVFWWTLIVLPASVAVVEEMVFRGYLQPRLISLTGSTWIGVLVTAAAFALPHVAMPLLDWQTSTFRFLTTFLVGIAFGLFYLRLKRLVPLIIGHWAVDVVFLGLLPLLAALGSR